MEAFPTTGRRVLFLSPQPFFEWRGSPIRIAFDLQALTELGYTVDLLTFPVGQDRQIPGVTIHRIPRLPGVRDVPIGPSPRKALLDVLLLFKGLAMVLRTRYDVIHGVEEAGAIGELLAPLRHSHLVFEKHSDPASYRRGLVRNLVLWLYARVENRTARRADAVIVTGTGLAEQVRRLNPSVHDIFDIPSSLVEPEPGAVARARREWCRREGDVIIAYVGSFAVYQGVDLIFRSIPEVVAKHPEARFVIVGGSPAQVAARRAELEKRGVADAVLFAGLIAPDVLPNYLAAADVLLSPRLSGVNTPLKLLDYFKAGRAVLATDTPANRLLLDETNALIVKPEAFAEGLSRLITDRELRERLGRAGRVLVETRYNFQNFKGRLADCYAGLSATYRRTLIGLLWDVLYFGLLAGLAVGLLFLDVLIEAFVTLLALAAGA